jgi:SAM-dependent methyltransferase
MTCGGLKVPEVETCRSCGSARLTPFLDLGSTPIANALAGSAAEARSRPTFPLVVGFCLDCCLVQLLFELPASSIFDEEYPYYSSFSDSLLEHAKAHVDGLVADRSLGADDLVIELASNDGYLLRHFGPHRVPVLGIDPSPGPAEAARAAGVETITAFFTPELARELRSDGRRADVVIANNVLAHVPDLNGFVEGIALLLADDGIVTIENPYVRDLVAKTEFDTVYHEHFCYFSCSAITALANRHGLDLLDVDYFPHLHGGTLRWTLGRGEPRDSTVDEYLRAEAKTGLTSPEYYFGLSDRVTLVRDRLLRLLDELRMEGRVAAYGAAAKGATLLNSCGIGTDRVEYVVDRNPHKVGRWIPGAGLPVLPVDMLLDDRPEHVLLLAWNFADEIVRQQSEYLEGGGRFLLPVPTPQLLASAQS